MLPEHLGLAQIRSKGFFGNEREGIDAEILVSLEVVKKMSKETVSMFGCCIDKNEELFGIGGEGCDAEISVSSAVLKKRSKGTTIMSWCCTNKNKVLFEVVGGV